MTSRNVFVSSILVLAASGSLVAACGGPAAGPIDGSVPDASTDAASATDAWDATQLCRDGGPGTCGVPFEAGVDAGRDVDDANAAIDSGTPIDSGTSIDSGISIDSGMCTPPVSLSAIGVACTGAADCPTGYVCQGFSGVVFTQSCEIRCTPTGCPCPATTACNMHGDKGPTPWYQCDRTTP